MNVIVQHTYISKYVLMIVYNRKSYPEENTRQDKFSFFVIDFALILYLKVLHISLSIFLACKNNMYGNI